MTPRTTDEPKDIRLEFMLSESSQAMLEFCVEVFGVSKAEIIRRGIEEMNAQAQRQRDYEEAYDDETEGLDDLIKDAEEARGEEVYEDAYKIAYDREFKKEYANLISDRKYTPSDAKEDANYYARDIAEEEAREAVRDFWDS